jgi:ABC-2 type transport system permease protein
MNLLLKLSWIEAKLFLREPLTVIFTFAFPFFMLIVLAGVFGNEVDPTDTENLEAWAGVGPVDYYAPSYVLLVLMSVGIIALPLRLATYRERGVLRRFRAAGFPLASVLGSHVVVAIVVVIIGAIGIGAAARVFYGAGLPSSWPLSIASFAVSAACFCAIGIALGAILPGARAAQGAGITLFFIMMMIGGAGPPRGVLSDPMRWMSNPLPFTHSVLSLQDPWLRSEWDWIATGIVVAFTAGALVIAFRAFRWE